MKYLRKLIIQFIIVTCVAASFVQTEANAAISQSAQAHIKQRHWYNASSGSKTSRFQRSMTTKKLDSLAQVAIKKGTARPSKHGQGRLTYQHRFKYPLGVNTNGSKAYSLRVVTDKKGNIITAFPT